MTHKVHFNWLTLDRQMIADHVLLLSDKIVDQELSIDSAHKKIVRHIKKFLPLKFKKNRNHQIKSNHIWVGGSYYGYYDQDQRRCMEVIFEYPLFQDTIMLTRSKFNKMALSVADTLLHEIIHMSQHRKRNYGAGTDYKSNATRLKIKLEQEYLGSADEIDAYAFNIACELSDKFKGSRTSILAYLDEDQQGKQRTHNSWRMYLKAFEHDHEHPVIKRTKKKILQYLPRVKSGKPYKNNNWIQR